MNYEEKVKAEYIKSNYSYASHKFRLGELIIKIESLEDVKKICFDFFGHHRDNSETIYSHYKGDDFYVYSENNSLAWLNKKTVNKLFLEVISIDEYFNNPLDTPKTSVTIIDDEDILILQSHLEARNVIIDELLLRHIIKINDRLKRIKED